MLAILEEYLRDEGFYSVIPEHRRRTLFRLPIVVIWVVFTWGPAFFLVISRSSGLEGLIVAALMPPMSFLTSLVLLAVFFVIRQFRTGTKLTNKEAGSIGFFFTLVPPLLIAIAVGVYLDSWLSAFIYIVICAVGVVVVLFMQMQVYRIHLLTEGVRSAFRALGRSLALLMVLIPLLLIVVVLSVFSQELWQALATLSTTRLVGSVACLMVPVIVLGIASLNRETKAIVGTFPDKNQILERAKNIPYIKDKLDQGLMSLEEWNRLKKQLEWRSAEWLTENLMPPVFVKTRQWLSLLLILTSLTLIISFSLYFYVFFSVTLEPSLIESWVGTGTVLPSWAMAKVSFVLAVFIAVMASVYALTDETIKGIFTEWLRDKSSSWLAVSALYLCAISPDYEILEYLMRDKKQGRVNVSIVVPKGLSEEGVKDACEHIASKLDEYRHLVIVTAYEEKPERPVYKLGMPGNRWRLTHNKVSNIRHFEPIPLELDGELRYQHFLGLDSLNQEQEISNDWFGNTPSGVGFARIIWENDTDHEWVLHPYVFQNGAFAGAEISLTKRKTDQNFIDNTFMICFYWQER